jgi:taurine--2-oxoglutarate transaminase
MENNQIIKNCLDYTLFSWVKQSGLNPINAERAKGVYVYDRDGKKYLDFSSQLMNVNIGHGNPRITQAVANQMEEFSYVYPGMATKARAKLGKKLTEITPSGLSKSFFTLGGADAIENSIKMARFYTGRHKIITHYRSYHGATYGAMSAGGDPRRHPMDQLAAPGFVHIENPYFYRCPWNSQTADECGEMALRNLEQVVKYEDPNNVAAIMMEGESGSSGCMKYPPYYLRGVRKICDKYGILLISDEVMSGFGRTGKWFGIDHHDVTPDIMAVAKGLTSGYLPLGATIISDELAQHFNDHHFTVGLTYSSHAACCAAAVENIAILEEENMVHLAESTGKYIESEVEKLQEIHPSIGDFRNAGLLGCIELVKDKKTKEPTVPWNASGIDLEPTKRMAAKVRELGMFTFVRWNFIFIAPPLNISKEEVDEGLNIISKVISIADEYC